MKFLLLGLWMLLCPVIASHLRRTPRHLTWAAFALGLMPFVLNSWHLYVAPISWAGWPGHTKGLELSTVDFLAIAILAATSKADSKARLVWPWVFYAAAAFIALPYADERMAAFFYVWQLLRMILVYVTAIRLTSYQRAPESLLSGIFAGICFQAGYAIMEAARGAGQASGALGSQNLLGLVAHFALLPALALLLAGRRNRMAIVGLLAAVIVDALTASRATLGFAAIASGILLATSCARSFTGRKGAVLAAAVLMVAVLTPVALKNIDKRKNGNTVESSNIERAAFMRTAWLIIGDYPLGTGPNQYVMVANIGGYAARAGVNWNGGSRATNVHNSYMLVWAESGWLGLLAMLCLIFAPMLTAFRAAFRNKRDWRGDVLLGLAVAMMTAALHFLYEWLFVIFIVQYLFALVAGTSVGLASQMARDKARRRKSVAEQPAPEPFPRQVPAS